MTPRRLVLSVFLVLLAASAFAHAGHQHHFLGTVKQLNENHLVVTTTTGADMTFMVDAKTRITRDENAATAADLKAGMRVSVTVLNDGHTADTIKIGSAK